jgi:Bacterial Ig domain/Papain family cysteine protease
MKLSRKRFSIAALFLVTLLWASCKKEVSNQSFEKPQALQNLRVSGVVADDPNLVSKVPMIISSDLLKKVINEPALLAALRGGRTDKIPPTVSITTSSNTATITGTIIITVTATDNAGVSSVSLSVDGNVVLSSYSSPFTTLSWSSATVSNGTHTLMVTARDAAGNTGSSNSIQVSSNNVSGGDITKPTVSITSPANGASVSGTLNITVSASDNIGVGSVKFSDNGTQVGSSDNSSPYSFLWNTTTAATGIHTLTATATDAAGNSSLNSIQVTVNTVVITPPILPASYQLAMPPVSNQGSEGSCVSFAVGYAARSSEQYYRKNATSYSLSSNIFSPEFLYNQIKASSSCSSGSSILGALEFLKSTGICTWQSMPYSSSNGCDLLPTSAQTTEAASFKITSYSGIYTADLTSIKAMLSSNHPLIITFAVDQSFYNAGPDFIWKNYSSTIGAIHGVAICGYDDAKHAVKIMNSWGINWGDAGYSWIDYDFLPLLTNQVCVMNL